MSEIGDRIKQLRLDAGLGQGDLGVTNGYISLIESGDRDPSMEAIFTIAQQLNVPPLYLATGRLENLTCPWCGRNA